MPFPMSDAEHKAWLGHAETLRVPLAIWIRLTLNAESDKLAAPKAQPAASKPVGRPGTSLDEFLDRFSVSDPDGGHFESGQRRYGFIVRRYASLADDELAHAAYEKDLTSFKASGKDTLKAQPNLWTYADTKRHEPA